MIVSNWDKERLLRSSVLAGFAAALFAAAPAVAQEPEQTDAEEEEEASSGSDDRIVVTGSRIARDEFSSTSPIQVITPDQAALAGTIGIDDIIQESTIAAASNQINDFFTGFVTNGGPGANTISLRGLGANRTLVLLNGRRLNPAGTRGTVSAVDLNVIPTAAVARVEILKDGASSVYGSDAVAGVVNIITDTDFEGVVADAGVQVPFGGGGEIYNLSITAGSTFDRGNFVSSVSYEEFSELAARERPEWGLCPAEWYVDPVTGERIDTIDTSGTSPGGPGAFKCFGAANYIINRETNTRYQSDPTQTDSTGLNVPGYRNVQADVPGRNWFTEDIEGNDHLISPAQRLSFTTFINYDLFPEAGIEAFGEFLFTNRRSSQLSSRQIGVDVPSDHPDNPFPTGAGPDFALALPVVQYLSAQEVDSARFLGGLRGDFGFLENTFMEDWNWEVSYSYGRSMGRYGFDAYDADAIANSVDLVETAPGSGIFDCAVNVNRSAGALSNGPATCVPLRNPFGDAFMSGNFDAAWQEYTGSFEYGTTDYYQHSINAFASGTLFELPAGPVGVALGIDWRQEGIDDVPGVLSQSYTLFGFTSSGRTQGVDEVGEYFAEFDIPVVRDLPFIQSLDFSASGRVSSYNSGYDGETYKLGFNWVTTDWLRFRGTYGTSFRAPALFELFLGGQTAFSNANDPCEEFGIGLIPDPNLVANCTSEGLPPNWGGFTSTPQVITFGNFGRLDAETSLARTLGVVFQPDFDRRFLNLLDGLQIAVDYWDFEIENQVARYGTQSILNQCYNLDPALFRTPGSICDFVAARDPQGNIPEVNDSYFNLSSQFTDGIDLSIRYERETPVGDLLVNWLSTWTFSKELTELAGAAPRDFNGTVGDPSLVSQLNFNLYRGAWTFFYGVEYVAPMSDNFFYGVDARAFGFPVDVEAYYEHDVSARYEQDDWAVTVGIRNLGDETPPSISDFGARGPGVSAFYTGYDRRGRTAFANVTKRF